MKILIQGATDDELDLLIEYYKLTVKSYYANVELEFLSSVVKISEHIDNNQGNKDVAKVVGKVLANDIKKNKTLDPEKKKKHKK